MKHETEYKRILRDNFHIFGTAIFLYACFYVFCMFENKSGFTYPLYIGASLLLFFTFLSKLKIPLKKESLFYTISIMLLALSTFFTDDNRIIFFNKTGIFLLIISFLLGHFYNTAGWQLGKFFLAISETLILCLGELDRPIRDGVEYIKNVKGQKRGKLGYVVLGIVVAAPLLLIVMGLLGSADAIFRQLTDGLFGKIDLADGLGMLPGLIGMYFGTYMLWSCLCGRHSKEEVKDGRTGEPVLAITVTGLLTALYLLFSGIQIVYLFLGKMQLPAGYTYAEYAREGFFQLLAVSFLNLVIVLFVLGHFRENKVLKIILTVMSACTYIMIVSSAMRMIIYIQYYYMTFQRILVLWALLVLAMLFAGVVIRIYKPEFCLFQFGVVVVTVLYMGLSFSHPDYIIAKINVSQAEHRFTVWERKEGDFFKSEMPYQDFYYLEKLSADAAPVLIPYMAELGYYMNDFFEGPDWRVPAGTDRGSAYGFGYYYFDNLGEGTRDYTWRSFNISRYQALQQIEKYRYWGKLPVVEKEVENKEDISEEQEAIGGGADAITTQDMTSSETDTSTVQEVTQENAEISAEREIAEKQETPDNQEETGNSMAASWESGDVSTQSENSLTQGGGWVRMESPQDMMSRLRGSVKAFEMIGNKPYLIYDSQLLCWQDEHWESVEMEQQVRELFADDTFCALDENGKIIWEGEETDLSDMPLGSAAVYYGFQQLMAVNQNTPFQTLNQHPISENVVALCENRELITLPSSKNYEVTVIPFEKEVVQLSGKYVLTAEGEVYQLKGFDNGNISATLVSESSIVEIAACPTANRCIGICEDGTVTMWSDLEPFDLSEWTDVVAVEMGDNYCAGLSAEGEVYFASYDGETDTLVKEWLAGRNAIAIACVYQRIAVLQEDLSVVMLYFS